MSGKLSSSSPSPSPSTAGVMDDREAILLGAAIEAEALTAAAVVAAAEDAGIEIVGAAEDGATLVPPSGAARLIFLADATNTGAGAEAGRMEDITEEDDALLVLLFSIG
jgi:hypothetical protein